MTEGRDLDLPWPLLRDAGDRVSGQEYTHVWSSLHLGIKKEKLISHRPFRMNIIISTQSSSQWSSPTRDSLISQQCCDVDQACSTGYLCGKDAHTSFKPWQKGCGSYYYALLLLYYYCYFDIICLLKR